MRATNLSPSKKFSKKYSPLWNFQNLSPPWESGACPRMNIVYKDFLRKLPLPLVYESNVSISTLTSYSPLLELPLRENFILKWKDLIWKQHSWAAKSFLWTFCLWQKHQQWQEMMHIEVSVEITFSLNFLTLWQINWKNILNWFQLKKVAN